MGLLRADLRALANLPATAPGRRVLVSTVLGLGLLGFLWWSVSAVLLEHPQVLARLHGRTGDPLRALLGTALMPCPIVAAWLGLALAQRQLFEAPELVLWRTAPIRGWRAPIQVLLRATFLTFVWATALSVPFVATLLHRTASTPPLAWALVPVAIGCCTLPVLCTVLAFQILLVRFFSGPLLRLALALASALASIGFSAWLLVGLFTPVARSRAPTGAFERVPWTVDAAANLLASSARGGFAWPSLRQAVGGLGLTLALYWFVARLYPRAVERHLEARPSGLLRRRRRWPAGIAAVMRRKEFAQVLQQPGAAIGFLLFAVLVFTLVRERVAVGSLLADRHLAPPLAQLAAMLVEWFLAVLLVLYAHMGRLALWDGPQWSLYMTAPASPWSILRGKLAAVAVLLLWPLVLVGVFGAWSFGAGPATVLAFVGTALGGTLAALGVLAAVGTSPLLMRPDEGGQITHSGRSFVAAIALVVLFQLVLAPAFVVWPWLAARVGDDVPVVAAFGAIVGGALVLGGLVGLAGGALGARNFRKLATAR